MLFVLFSRLVNRAALSLASMISVFFITILIAIMMIVLIFRDDFSAFFHSLSFVARMICVLLCSCTRLITTIIITVFAVEIKEYSA